MKKILFAVIAAILLFTLISCESKDEVQNPAPTTIDLTKYEKFAVVKPENGSDEVISAAAKAYNAVKDATGKEPIFCVDLKKNDEKTLEILIGNTSRVSSGSVARFLRTNDCYVGTCEDSIVVAGGNDESTLRAIELFAEAFGDIYEKGVFAPDDCISVEGEYAVQSADIGGIRPDRYTIVYPAGDENCEYQANLLSKRFSEKYGYCVPVIDDGAEAVKYEILVGATSRKESEYLADDPLPVYCYDIKLKGTRLVFASGSLWAFETALDDLNGFVKDGVFSISKGTDVSVTDASVKASEQDFVYITTKGRQGDVPVKKLTLCGADIAEYVIVYHDYGKDYTGPFESETFAAKELQTYIEYASGIRLPLVKDTEAPAKREIIVGTTTRETDGTLTLDRAKFGREGLYYATHGERLVFAGEGERGTLYAVYDFLEEYLGCRFFSSDCEIIFDAETIDLKNIDVYEESDLEYRDNDTFSVLSARTAPKVKLNSQFRRQLDAAHGGCITFLNGNEGFTHTMSRYLSLGPENRQPCLTSETTYTTAVAQIRKYLESDPNADIVSIVQNDNNNYCTCAECAHVNREEGSNAGTLIRFVNRIAEEVGKDYPNVKFLTLAYMYSSDPTKTAPAPNVIIELCNFEDCLANPVGTCSGNEKFLKRLQGWHALTDNVYIWYYGCAFWIGNEDTPFMNVDAVYDEFKIYRENGVKGVFIEGRTEQFGHEFGELRAYLISKLMWDKDFTREEYNKAAREFICAYYGPASGMVQKYYDFLNAAAKGCHYDLWAGPESALNVDFYKRYSDEIASWWDTAMAIEHENRDTERHVKDLYKGYQFVQKSIG